MHGTSASSHHCLAASLPSSSFAIGVDPVVARRTFTDTAISPPASAGSVVAPTMIGGLFGDMTYVRSHLSGPAAVTVTGFGCTP
jgi:hypothetical protein